MNKKIIALLLVVALACSGVFAMGIGGMSSNTAGYGALTYAPSKGGLYYGIGWGYYGIGISAEKNILSANFFNADIFALGYQVGFGANLGINFIGGFGFGAGVYGLAGLHFDIDVIPNIGIELFGQWQPTIYFNILPSFGFDYASWFGGYASGVRFWL